MTYGLMTNGWIWLPCMEASATTGARIKPARVEVVAEPTATAKLQVKAASDDTSSSGPPAGTGMSCRVTVRSS